MWKCLNNYSLIILTAKISLHHKNRNNEMTGIGKSAVTVLYNHELKRIIKKDNG